MVPLLHVSVCMCKSRVRLVVYQQLFQLRVCPLQRLDLRRRFAHGVQKEPRPQTDSSICTKDRGSCVFPNFGEPE